MYPDQNDSYSRPLLIVSNSILHQNTDYFISVGITTNQDSHPYLLSLPRKEVEGGVLDRDSQVMCHRITSLRHKVIEKKVATVTPDFYNKVITKIKMDILQL